MRRGEGEGESVWGPGSLAPDAASGGREVPRDSGASLQ